MKTLVICSNVDELMDGGFRNPEICNKYPGSGWTYRLYATEAYKDWRILSGREALEDLGNPQDYYVIQEEMNECGHRLIQKGAHPSLLLCFESPLYTPLFYAELPTIKPQWKAQMLFSGGTHKLHFPCFDVEDVQPLVPWKDRQLVSAVFSCRAGVVPLLASRLEYAHHFARTNRIGLYGRGWADNSGIPEAKDKVDILRNYKFNICFENLSHPGYLTEKIIDCFVAGTIPIYQGDPEMRKTLKGLNMAWIDPSYFDDNISRVDEYMTQLPEDQAMHLIDEGRKWLMSKEGLKHSHRVFARNVMNIIQEQVEDK